MCRLIQQGKSPIALLNQSKNNWGFDTCQVRFAKAFICLWAFGLDTYYGFPILQHNSSKTSAARLITLFISSSLIISNSFPSP